MVFSLFLILLANFAEFAVAFNTFLQDYLPFSWTCLIKVEIFDPVYESSYIVLFSLIFNFG